MAAVGEDRIVKGRSGISIVSDTLLTKVSALSSTGEPEFDALLIPGGPGVAQLREDGRAAKLAAIYGGAGCWVAAICAAPVILSDAGLLANRRFTAHFSVMAELPQALREERVVVDGNLITSRGAGTALDFGLVIVRTLMGSQKMDEVAASIMI